MTNSTKKNIVSIFILLQLLLPQLAKSNCEAGGYMIHTKATYKESDNLVYAILSEDGNIEINSLDDDDSSSPFRKSLVGEYSVQYGNEKCSKAKVEIDGVDVYGNGQLLVSNMVCAGKKLNKSTYIVLDTLYRKIVIGQRLSLSKVSKRSPSNIERDIVLKNKFPGSHPSKNIEHKDIINLNNFQVHETLIGDSFSIVVAELYIKEVAKYFKQEGYAYYGKQYMNFENVKVGYPVLMFSTEGKTEYVGDGSHCSEVPVMYRNMDLVNREMKLKDQKYEPSRGAIAKDDAFPKDENGLHDLGLIDRFHVTNAFDMDGDGKVDVIEINGRFAYRVLDNFKFEVINMGMGC